MRSGLRVLFVVIVIFAVVSSVLLHTAHSQHLSSLAAYVYGVGKGGGPPAAVPFNEAGGAVKRSMARMGRLAHRLAAQREKHAASDRDVAPAVDAAGGGVGTGAGAGSGQSDGASTNVHELNAASGSFGVLEPPTTLADGAWWLERPTERPSLERCLNTSWFPRPGPHGTPAADMRDASEYPRLFNVRRMMQEWPRDAVKPARPSAVKDSLCRFDVSDPVQRAAALKYRDAELPFIAYNVKAVDETARKWSWDYLEQHHRGRQNTVSTTLDVAHPMYRNTNHFMYWRSAPGRHKNWAPPTRFLNWPLKRYLKKARSAKGLEDAVYYFKTSTVQGEPWIQDDLHCWRPGDDDFGFFVRNPSGQRGVHCRFGIPGTIADAHSDGGRNMVAVLKGARRYMMTPPGQCRNLYFSPPGHPQARHTEVDWSRTEEWGSKNTRMAQAMGFEAVIARGDVLFIPSLWVHHIVSLTMAAQCNTRSGKAKWPKWVMKGCGYIR